MRDFFRAFFRSWLPGFRYVLLSWAIACGASAALVLLAGIAYAKPWAGFGGASVFCIAGIACLCGESAIDTWLHRGEG